jgi:hypothetical protein
VAGYVGDPNFTPSAQKADKTDGGEHHANRLDNGVKSLVVGSEQSQILHNPFSYNLDSGRQRPCETRSQTSFSSDDEHPIQSHGGWFGRP